MDRETKARKLATLGHALESLGFTLLERELTVAEQHSLKQTLEFTQELINQFGE